MALLPISLSYILIVFIVSAFTTPKKHGIPVIAVGGATIGGSGKTPVTIALVKALKAIGKNPHIITRGYGKECSFNEEVLSEYPIRYGDEAVLLAKHARTWSGSDKNALIEMAIKAGADVTVLDDGMQSFNVHKDVEVLVVSMSQGVGNGMVVPSGPLREPFCVLKNRANFIVKLNDSDGSQVPVGGIKGKPVLQGEIVESLEMAGIYKAPDGKKIVDKRVVAFCALGYPEKFLLTLKRLNKEVVKFVDYPDHYVYTKKDLLHLVDISKKFHAKLVTTEKDLVKIAPNFRSKFNVVSLSVNIKGLEDHLANLLK